ncbi:unnamed protein product [Sphenostylis stenocarpa]|uniref:Protein DETOXIFICATION n=1 Tax=Sphenostylis stenocarpa TaxID=92480 RepID=A0AA86SBY7_9FABA|nr:unnamed protein product [Sphenostylis stenocarpa]
MNMTEDHSGSTPLLSHDSDRREDKIDELNDDNVTQSERSQSTLIRDVSCLTLNFVYMLFFSMHLHASNETSHHEYFSQVLENIKDLYTIAIPTIISGLLTYGKSAITIHFLGRLGKEALAGGSLAIAMANISAYSIISGLATGMEGISSQACGAQQWNLVGETLQCTIMILIITCIPISIVWFKCEPILLLFGQDPTITSIATTYLAFSLPDLVSLSLMSPLKIFMRTQGVTLPLMYSAGLSLLLHALMNYAVINTFGLGIEAISLVGAITNLNLIIFVMFFLWYSGACSQSWQGLSWKCFSHWKPILCQGVPSCVSVCLEWWWYELLIIFSGLLENAADSMSAYAIIIQATSFMYNFPYALGLAVSTKVGNELGANRPNKAKSSSFTALLCACFTAILAMLSMVTMSRVWGLMYIQDEAVLSLLTATLPIVGLCELGNCPQTTICGVLRGSARPLSVVNINFISFYAVGLPVAIVMGLVYDFGLLGLMYGLLSAQIVCAIVMVFMLTRTDWKEEANRARKLVSGISESNEENNEDMEAVTSAVLLN